MEALARHAAVWRGVQLVQRIAALNGLDLRYRTRGDGQGVVAQLGLTTERPAGPSKHKRS